MRRTLIMGAEDGPPPSPPGAPPVGIGEGTLIQDAIIDLNARIGRNARIVNKDGVKEADGDSWVIRDGIVVIPKNARDPRWDDDLARSGRVIGVSRSPESGSHHRPGLVHLL